MSKQENNIILYQDESTAWRTLASATAVKIELLPVTDTP
jgi:hypothetical protein